MSVYYTVVKGKAEILYKHSFKEGRESAHLLHNTSLGYNLRSDEKVCEYLHALQLVQTQSGVTEPLDWDFPTTAAEVFVFLSVMIMASLTSHLILIT